MNFFEGIKLILVGIIVVLLAAIPLTVYFLQQSQETRSRAQKATTLYFALPDQMIEQTTPIQKKTGDTFSVDVIANPGTNFISFAKVTISYDATKLATQGAGIEPITTGTQGLPSVLEGPLFESGTMSLTLSVGADVTKIIQQPTKIAKVTFKALASTDSTPTQVKFIDGQTQVLSSPPSCQTDPANCVDQASENVLASARPVTIAISTNATVSGTPTPTVGTATPTTPPVTTPVPTTPQAANVNPTCTSLTLDGAPSGTAPFAVSFTATGADSDGTISKVTFNFGDGPVQDLTQSEGIGTKNVSAQVSHTYSNAGTYQASAILTDNRGGISSNTCTQSITVTAAAAGAGGNGGGGGGGVQQPAATTVAGAKPTMAAPGASDTILQIGVIGTILSIIGALTFFSL